MLLIASMSWFTCMCCFLFTFCTYHIPWFSWLSPQPLVCSIGLLHDLDASQLLALACDCLSWSSHALVFLCLPLYAVGMLRCSCRLTCFAFAQHGLFAVHSLMALGGVDAVVHSVSGQGRGSFRCSRLTCLRTKGGSSASAAPSSYWRRLARELT